jgi:hypothetical protein
MDLYKQDPEGVKEVVMSIMGPVIKPLGKGLQRMNVKNALDNMEKDKENFPHYDVIKPVLAQVISELPDEQLPKDMIGYKYLYDAAVGKNLKTILESATKAERDRIYKDLADKEGIVVESDDGSGSDVGLSSEDAKEIDAILNAGGSKLP